MKKIFFLSIMLLSQSMPAYADDVFAAIRCGADIPSAMVGKHYPKKFNLDAIQKQHQDTGLTYLGADGGDGHLRTSVWRICGGEYQVLEDMHFLVKDVLLVPGHSKTYPEFFGEHCRLGDQDIPETTIAFLNNEAGIKAYAETDDTVTLPALSAWKIDPQKAKFVKLDTTHLRCPADEIITEDGGR